MRNFFTTYKNPVTVIIVIIILAGTFVYSSMQTALFPEITFPKIKVIADAGQQPVKKMMITVTQQLENAIKQVPDLRTIRSITSRGSCEISAFMNWNANIDISQQRIESKITEIRNNLPPDVQITVERMNPSILPVIQYSLESNSRTPIDLKLLAMYTIKPFLSQVEGVSEVRVIGGKTKEYWLILNQQKMNTLGITPDNMSNALSQTNFIKSNGYLSDYRLMYLTLTDASVSSKEQLENIVISNNSKRIILLKDIAEVQIQEAKEYVKINANGREGILLGVLRQPNANVIDLSKKMQAKLEDLKKILPKDVSIKPYYVQADFVYDSIKSVTDSLWIGLVLAIVVAIVFLRSLKAGSVILITILAASAFYIFQRLETGFLPEMDEGSIVLDYWSPPGTSLAETDRILQQVEKIIVQEPEVQAYSRRTGTQMGFFITEPNTGDYLIQLKKDRHRTTDEVISDIRNKIESSQHSLRVDFGQVIGDMLGDLMTSVQPVEVKIFGNDQNRLQQLSKQVADIAEQVQGTADVFDGVVIAGPSIDIEPNSTTLAQFGITPANLQMQLQTALEGNVTGSVYDKNQLSNIRMVYPGNKTLSINDINQLQIFLPDGKLKPISSLANVRIAAGEAEIQREDMQSMGVVTARLENRDLGSVMKDIRQQVSSKISLPQGYAIVYGGAYAEQQQSFKELLTILIASSLLVFGVILFLYKDFSIAFTILLIAVLGISGSYMALYFTNTALNVGSYTGLIMIVGIIGENAIFTFLQFNESFKESQNVDESVVYSISTRLRPKLMTALGAIIALMPIALGIGTGAQLHQPLAIAVIGGFLVAMPLLLIVLPTFIRMIYKKRNK